MIPDKMKVLINKLIEQTSAGNLSWNKSSRETEYVTTFKAGRITSDLWMDEETGQDLIDLSIYNNNGDRIEYLCFPKEATLLYNEIYNLYNVIQRDYLKADETIDGIFSELEDKCPF